MKIQPICFLVLLLVTVRTSNAHEFGPVSQFVAITALSASDETPEAPVNNINHVVVNEAATVLIGSNDLDECQKNNNGCGKMNGEFNDFKVVGDVVDSGEKNTKHRFLGLADKGSWPLARLKAREKKQLSTLGFFRDAIQQHHDWETKSTWKIQTEDICKQYDGKCVKFDHGVAHQCHNDTKGNPQLRIGECGELGSVCCYDTSEKKEGKKEPQDSIECKIAVPSCLVVITISVQTSI